MVKKWLILFIVISIITSNILVGCYEIKASGIGKNHKNSFDNNYAKERKISLNLDKYLKSEVLANNFHGLVLVSRKGKILLNKGYSMPDFEKKIKNKPNTTFPIGSTTKQFIALSIMQLVDQGKLSLVDKLSKFLLKCPNSNKITIRQILMHRAGLSNYFQTGTEATDVKILGLSEKDKTVENVINIIIEQKPASKPDKVFEYCNTGYLILGYIVEKISGDKLDEYLYKHNFEPCGMKNTRPAYIDGKKMYTAIGYKGYLENNKDESNSQLLSIAFGAGYISSNTNYLGKYLEALSNNKLISVESRNEMFSPHTDLNNIDDPYYKDLGYGYGWFVSKKERMVTHGGSTGAANAELAKFLDDDINLVILTNRSSSSQDLGSILNNVDKFAKNKDVEMPKPRKSIKIDDKILKKYVGTYINNKYKDLSFKITYSENKLYIKGFAFPKKYELLALSNEEFYTKLIYEKNYFELFRFWKNRLEHFDLIFGK